MPKRKHFPRLPSGYGSIRFVGKNRSRPYAVHPPSNERDDKGFYIRSPALCYVEDWYTGFAVLTAYHAGTYTPGMELTIRKEASQSTENLDLFCKRVLKNMQLAVPSLMPEPDAPTFKDVFDQYYQWKFGEQAAKKLSKSSSLSSKSAFNMFSSLHDSVFADITLEQIQSVINSLDKSKSSVNNAVLLVKQMYRYAVPRELCKKDYGAYVVARSTKSVEHHEAFSDKDLTTLWKNSRDPVIRMVLVMCYSGFRVSAYETIETNLEELYFRGGIKTDSGKDRIVPIHSGIVSFVRDMNGTYLCGLTNARFRQKMTEKLSELGLAGFTPHSCRHTFSRLCETYCVNEADRKRMMGHSFGSDITNSVYGHRSLDELRAEIEKIKICDFLCPVDHD